MSNQLEFTLKSRNNKKVIIIFFILILIVVTIVIYYIKYERLLQNIKYVNITISTYDRNSGKLVKTGYLLYVNNILVENSTTEKYVNILKQFPEGKNITIITYNLKNQSYYSSSINFTTNSSINPKRVKLKLIPYGKLKLKYNVSNNKIYVDILSDGIVKNLTFCLNWTTHVIYAKFVNLTKIDNDCYIVGKVYDKEIKKFIVDYKTFGEINEKDEIEISFYHNHKNYFGVIHINNI